MSRSRHQLSVVGDKDAVCARATAKRLLIVTARLAWSAFSYLQPGAFAMARSDNVRYGSGMEEAIRIDKLCADEHQLHSYCHCCDRWSALSVDEMLPQWRDLEHVPAVVPCAECGELGMLKVRSKLAAARERPPEVFMGWLLAG